MNLLVTSKRNYFFIIVVLIVGIAFISYRSLIAYGIAQATGQLLVIVKAKPIETFLANPNYPDSLKLRIHQFQRAKEFGAQLGLKQTDNYTKIYDQKNQTILWNLSACAPFQFEEVTWDFPFVGSFGYKGFFDLDKAKTERDQLIAQGFDVQLRGVSAWSTLGWFKDPILSKMLNNQEADMVETLFHELTHGTIFLKDRLQFNENLASFVGQKATIQYLNKYYGAHSEILKDYINGEEDAKKFRSHMLLGKVQLDSLYNTFGDKQEQSTKNNKKDALIGHIVRSLEDLKFHNNRYYHLFEDNPPNNAYFMSFERYYGENNQLDSIFLDLDIDIQQFILNYKEH